VIGAGGSAPESEGGVAHDKPSSAANKAAGKHPAKNEFRARRGLLLNESARLVP